MENSKFCTLLLLLSKVELKRFDSFLNGYYSGNTTRLELFEYIKRKKKNRLSFEVAHLKIYGKPLETEQDRKKILNLLSHLSNALDEFLVLQNLNKDPITKKYLILEAYHEIEYNSIYESQIKDFEKTIAKHKEQDITSFWYPFLLQNLKYYSSKNDKLRKHNNLISGVMYKLDHFFIGAKLKYACELESRRNLLTEDYKVLFIDDILEKAKQLDTEDDVFYQAYYQAYMMIRHKDEDAFKQLKSMIPAESSKEMLTLSDRKMLHTYLLNFCSFKIRKSDYRYVKEFFLLNEEGVKEGFIFENNTIPSTRFNNIVEVACKIGQVDWAAKFIEDYKAFLPENIRQDNYRLALAQIKFARKEFGDVIDNLHNINPSDPFLYIRKSWFLLSAYYETEPDNGDLITQNCVRFDAYLNKNKSLHKEIKIGAKNFSRMVRMLVKKKKTPQQLREELDKCKSIYFKQWLIKKIEELKN